MQSIRLAVIATYIWAATLAVGLATAQQPDFATINGTMLSLDRETDTYTTHNWTLTLQGLSYSYHELPDQYNFGSMTRVYAESFDFEFQGPRAAELNVNVSEPLVNSGLQDGPAIELRNFIVWESGSDWYDVRDWTILVLPSDHLQGLHFVSTPYLYEWPSFATDANGYPVLAPFTSEYAQTSLIDRRNLPDYGYSMGTSGVTLSVSSVGFALPGDFDRDRDVDGGDFLAWQRNPSLGDLADWQTRFGIGPGLAAAAFAVPEPVSLLLIALTIPALRRRDEFPRA